MNHLSVLVLAFVFSASALSAAEKPNFLLIIADDLCWRDIGCMGSPDAKTPNIDKLAATGMTLNGMFTPAPTCSPTRHALYTGLYPIRSGAYPNHTMVDRTTKSVFHYLKDLGYDVALHGKEHVQPKVSFPYEYLTNEANGGVTKASQYIADHQSGQPWFLVVASNEPHSPWTLGPKYDAEKITVPPYMHDNKTTRQQLAKYFAEISDLDRQVGELMTTLEETKQAENTLVMFVSEQGCSLPYGGKWSLYDTGIRIATFVRWPGKIEAGSSNSALMQYVDLAPTLVNLAGGDASTINTGCKDSTNKTGFDGQDFQEVLFGKTKTFRDYVFSQNTTVGVIGYQQPYPMRSVRDARYKLIRNLASANRFEINGIHKGEPLASWKVDAAANNDAKLAARIEWLYKRPAVELYDLEADEFERTNLAGDAKYAQIEKRLSQQLDGWMKQQGDDGLATELKAKSRQPGKKGKE